MGWKDTITKLRKAVYFGKEWDMMIPERKGVTALASAGDFTAGELALISYGNQASYTTPGPRDDDQGEAGLFNGADVDFAHVWVGIDCVNFPRVGLAFRSWTNANKEFATWAGDLGSALAERALKSVGFCADGGHTIECYIKYHAGGADQRGNIHGIAAGQLAKEGGFSKASELLGKLYGEDRLRIFRLFVEAQGWEFVPATSESSARLADDAYDEMVDEVKDFAWLWMNRIQHTTHGCWRISNWKADVCKAKVTKDDVLTAVMYFAGYIERGLSVEDKSAKEVVVTAIELKKDKELIGNPEVGLMHLPSPTHPPAALPRMHRASVCGVNATSLRSCCVFKLYLLGICPAKLGRSSGVLTRSS